MDNTPRYSLAGQIFVAPKHADIRGLRRVEEHELIRFQESIAQITDFATHYALLQICTINFGELMGFYKQVQHEFSKTHKIDETSADQILNEANRFLINYLSSFKTMIDHYQTRYTRLDYSGSQYLANFKALTNNIYDSSFSYRFLYKLRNYVQHCGLPVQSASGQVYQDEKDKVDAQIAIYFDRDSLLERFDGWGKVKQELKAQPTKMEISVHLIEFHQQVLNIYNGLIQTELEIMKEARNYLASLVSEVHKQLPGAKPLIIDFSKVSPTGGSLPILGIPVKELETINQIETNLYTGNKNTSI